MLAPFASATSALVQGGRCCLWVYFEALLDVGDNRRGGHHNEIEFLITTHPAGP